MNNTILKQRLADFLETLPANEWPKLNIVEFTSTRIVLSCDISADLVWFAGHFPGQPVLPGVVQTHWAGLLGQCLFEPNGRFYKMLNIKFQQMILPEQAILLELSYQPDKRMLSFCYLRDNTTFASGRLYFTSDPEA